MNVQEKPQESRKDRVIMQKNYLPIDDEYFDKIAEDAFDPEAEIHVFSDRYQKRKVKLMKKNTENNNRKPVMTKKRIAAG